MKLGQLKKIIREIVREEINNVKEEIYEQTTNSGPVLLDTDEFDIDDSPTPVKLYAEVEEPEFDRQRLKSMAEVLMEDTRRNTKDDEWPTAFSGTSQDLDFSMPRQYDQNPVQRMARQQAPVGGQEIGIDINKLDFIKDYSDVVDRLS